ncbi:hypothetical protein [Hyphomicrobium sp. D-2]|uniref:hypothetical protein n=1 Tax=Hyphomicrobium sp. D-2 TaxID=3041621 RepID=UPI00245774E9|nr:hypothetical protein [Hyphomicrobium sp. D-2]MDH4982074.1 hypothetical protein [Hyphomicrobium sp. D-2]
MDAQLTMYKLQDRQFWNGCRKEIRSSLFERTIVHGADTEVELLGDADVDFMQTVKSHHQDAIGMASFITATTRKAQAGEAVIALQTENEMWGLSSRPDASHVAPSDGDMGRTSWLCVACVRLFCCPSFAAACMR